MVEGKKIEESEVRAPSGPAPSPAGNPYGPLDCAGHPNHDVSNREIYSPQPGEDPGRVFDAAGMNSSQGYHRQYQGDPKPTTEPGTTDVPNPGPDPNEAGVPVVDPSVPSATGPIPVTSPAPTEDTPASPPAAPPADPVVPTVTP